MTLSTALTEFLTIDFSDLSVVGIFELRKVGSLLSIPSSVRSKSALLAAITDEVSSLRGVLNSLAPSAPAVFHPPTVEETAPEPLLMETPSQVEPTTDTLYTTPIKRSAMEQASFIVRELETKSPQEVAILVDASETAHFAPLTKIKRRRPQIDKLLPQTPICEEYKAAIKLLNFGETAVLNGNYNQAVQVAVSAPTAVDTTLLMVHVEKLRARVSKGSHVELTDALFLIALVTGRRLSECNNFDAFSPAGEYSLMFSGQTKRGSLPALTYEIPTLIPAAEVLQIMQKVRNFRILKSISPAVSAKSSALGLPDFKSMRSIYVRFVLHLVRDKHLISSAMVASKLLGHSTDGTHISTVFMSYEQLTVQFPDHALQLRSEITVEELRNLC